MRHARSWDLNGIADPAHRKVVQGALDACSFPFGRIRNRTGRRVPATVSNLSRFARQLAGAKGGHVHVHDEDGHEAHLLGEPEQRAAALGLYWLPTDQHPAGRVELDVSIMNDVPLAQEVFLAEAAHAVDYGAISPAQREQVLALFDHPHSDHTHLGWFEEQGEQDYWSWRGERWMGLFMAAFAPKLPRPLEARQPWHWTYDDADVRAVRRILRRP